MGTSVICLACMVSLAYGPIGVSAGPHAADLLPAEPGAAVGWQQDGPTLTYVPNNLWEYIDGAADGYLVFDFKLLAHADYVHPQIEGQKITVDVYEMATSEDAFGIYSVERSPESKFIDLGDQGYATPRSVNFHQDRFYIRLKAQRAREDSEQHLLAMARAVSARAPAGHGQPKMLRMFPRPSRVDYSERYLRGAVLGHAFLPRGYVADYREGEERVRLVAIDWPNARDAAAGMGKLKDFVAQSGGAVQPMEGLGDLAYQAKDRYLGQMLVFRQDRLMAAVVSYHDQDWGMQQARRLLARWRLWWGPRDRP